MRGELQEMARDFRRAPDFAVQQHERARALGVEWAAMQQIGEGADRRQAVIQRVENVGGAVVEYDVLNGRGSGGFVGRWRLRWGRGTRLRHRHLSQPAEQVAEQRADDSAEPGRDPELHAEKLCAARVCASRPR